MSSKVSAPAGTARPVELTALVVNHNSGASLGEAVARLKVQSQPPDEIIVIDSGSEDGSARALRDSDPEVQVIELGANLGPCVARNRGAEAARGRTLLLVDDDVYLEPDCIERLRATLVATGCVAAVPRLALYPETELIQLDGAEAHFIGTMVLRNGRERCDRTPRRVERVGAFSTSCVLIDREAFLDAGGFDETFFFHFEDLEMSVRLRALGHELVCDARALAFHDRGAGTPGLSFRDRGRYPRLRGYLTMRNRLQMIFIHYRLRALLLLMPAFVVYECASFAFALSRGIAWEWARAWVWQLRHARSLLLRRRAIRRRACLPEAQLVVGGALPLAAGLVRPGLLGWTIRLLSGALDLYWRLVRPLLGWRPDERDLGDLLQPSAPLPPKRQR